MMSDDQHYFELLRAADPAAPAAATGAADLGALRARVMAGTAPNVFAFTPRSRSLRMWRYASMAAVMAIVAGLGYAGGVARQAPTASIASLTPGLGLGGGSANDSMGKAAGATAGSYMAGYGGGIILRPEAGLPNDAGTAPAYRFNVDGIDLPRLASGLAAVIGATDVTAVPQSIAGPANLSLHSLDGRQSVSVDVYGGVANVSAYNDLRSPWDCTAVSTVPPSGPTPEASGEPETKCTNRGPAPSNEDAVRLVKAAFARLGIDAKGLAHYDATPDGMVGGPASTSVNVVVTPLLDGKPVFGVSWSAAVSALGLFSLNAWVANVEPLATYPIAGARDVANRTLQARWNSLGAQWVRTAATSGGVVSDKRGPTLEVVQVEGKPTVDAFVEQATVSLVSDGLQMRWLRDGTAVLMPAWLYRDAAGDEWSMLAISEQFINWTTQSAGGPVAYDTAAGGGSGIAGTATVVAPTPLK